jgi:NAD(P)-dependent dehydrogenase (short-subunit alcohol dehydrogenase family)
MSTQLWAHRLAAHRVSVYEVRTGIIGWEKTSTSLTQSINPTDIGALAESRLGTPDDIGRAVAMLARGDLSYATGNTFNIDGGLSLRRL